MNASLLSCASTASIFLNGAARVEDVLGRFKAREPLTHVADDFGVPYEDLEDAVRAVLPAAA